MAKAINVLAGALCIAAPTLAAGHVVAQAYNYSNPDDAVRINGGVGAMYLEGNEKVVSGNYTISHMIWQTTAPVLRGSIAVDVGHGVNINAEGSVAAWGGSYMEDYDWLRGDDRFNNWSDRSQYPDARLDQYFSGAASLRYELVKDDTVTIRVHGSFKYTDVQWTAYGGTYIYSDGGFRNKSGSFTEGQAGRPIASKFPNFSSDLMAMSDMAMPGWGSAARWVDPAAQNHGRSMAAQSALCR